jgi:ABC-type transport system involved in multi-copper enzyme maturation permease subunit
MSQSIVPSEPRVGLGPLFWLEWRRLTRQGSHVRFRVAYVLVLLLGIVIGFFQTAPPSQFFASLFGTQTMSIGEAARLGENLFQWLIGAQFLGLCLLTPLLVWGTIRDEWDRGTMEELLATPMSHAEIVFGKFLARVAFLLSVWLTGLPILALTMHFGGVDGRVLIGTVIVTLFCMLTLAAVSLYFSLYALPGSSVWQVYLSSWPYLFISVVGKRWTYWLGGVTPLGMLIHPTLLVPNPRTPAEEIPGQVIFCVVFHGCLIVMLVRWIIKRFPDHVVEKLERQKPIAPLAGSGCAFTDDYEDRPLIWRERMRRNLIWWEPRLKKGCWVFLAVLFVPLTIAVVISNLSGESGLALAARVTLQLAGVAFAGFVMPVVGLLAARDLVLDRKNRSLEELFLIPDDRASILVAKRDSSYEAVLPFSWLYFALLLMVVCSFATSLASAVILVALMLAQFHLCMNLGIWVGVRCSSEVRAACWYFSLLVLIHLVPTLVAVFGCGLLLSSGGGILYLSPLVAAAYLPGIEWYRIRGLLGFLATVILGCGLCVAFAEWLWSDAVVRFEQEGRGPAPERNPAASLTAPAD